MLLTELVSLLFVLVLQFYFAFIFPPSDAMSETKICFHTFHFVYLHNVSHLLCSCLVAAGSANIIHWLFFMESNPHNHYWYTFVDFMPIYFSMWSSTVPSSEHCLIKFCIENVMVWTSIMASDISCIQS